VNQREVTPTQFFAKLAARRPREDPPSCLIGEMRDLATIEWLCDIAETRPLDIRTLHTPHILCASTIPTSIYCTFSSQPAQQQIRAAVLYGYGKEFFAKRVSRAQMAVRRALIMEVLVPNPAIETVPRGQEFTRLLAMQTGTNQTGMQTGEL